MTQYSFEMIAEDKKRGVTLAQLEELVQTAKRYELNPSTTFIEANTRMNRTVISLKVKGTS